MKYQAQYLLRSMFLTVAILCGFAVHSAQAQDAETLAAISAAMDNPLSELFIFQTQYDHFSFDLPNLGKTKSVGAFKFIPTFPIPITSKINWVSRIVLPVNSVPLNDRIGDLLGVGGGPDAPLTGGATGVPQDVIDDIRQDPFKRTTGLGDIVYIALFGPRKPPKIGGNPFIWGVGPTTMFPTASKDVLGLGKYSMGPAAVLLYIPGKWRIGTLAQHWNSFAGDDDRGDVSMSNIQYFIFYAPSPTLSIGMSPNISINWEADGDKLTFPIGFGFNKTMFFGKLPVRLGAEFHYDAISPDDKAGAQWSFRVFAIPVIPAPWGELGKLLKKQK
ncbi:MAG: hypothetical protein E2O78_06660 [Caldithrix sp.]|nr:MAG: hypothetical protein E2O78_06660 [Caldithrix sp.]